MKRNLLLLFLLGFVVGCGDTGRRTSTDGASAEDIAEYEAAVAAAEGSMEAAVEEEGEQE